MLVLEEIGKVCYVTAMAALGEVGTQTRVICTYAPESIKRQILPRVATGEAILAICMTEPNAGTDVPNYTTNTEIKGDRVIVNGAKTLISPRRHRRDVRRVHARQQRAGRERHRLRAGAGRREGPHRRSRASTPWAAST